MTRSGLAVVAAGLAAVFAASAFAQEVGVGLSPAQQTRALEIEAANRPPPGLVARGSVGLGLPSLASTFAGQIAKSVTPLVAPLDTGSASNRAVVTRYDYATGVTTRTTVDLDSGKAVHARHDVNYPTPLAREEFEQAVALARKSVPEFEAIYKSATPAELRLHAQTPLYDNPKHRRYGHRLVTLWIEQPAPSARITVDLSTNEVEADHH